jgi:uncharacterized membrane protein YgcG
MSNLKESQTLRGVFYPRKITYTLSALKIITGCGLVLLGALALYQKASYARTASGVWAGIVVIICGVFGAFSVKMAASRPYVWAFFASCSMSIIATVLVIIYSATGLARDSGFPGGFVRDIDTGELIPVTEANFPPREGAMFINLGLILLGMLDILFTMPCCIICLRELCDCYNGMSGGSSLGLLDGGGHAPHQVQPPGYPGDDQSEWFYSYMGGMQGAPPPVQHQPVFFSQASGMPHHPGHSPYKYTAPPPYPTPIQYGVPNMSVPQSTPPFVMLHPSETSSGQSPGRRSRSQSGRGHDSSGSENKRKRSKSPRHSSAGASVDGAGPRRQQQQQVLMPAMQGMQAGAYAPVELYYPYVPPPMPSYGHAPAYGPAPGHTPYGPAPPWLPEYDAYYNQQFYDYSQYMMYPQTNQTRGRRSTSSRTSKRPRSKSGNRQQGGGGAEGGGGSNIQQPPPGPTSDPVIRRPKKNKSKKGPSDSDIEKTYTGLDRELAEEFIETTMADPGGHHHINVVDHQRNLQSGTESEAW